MLRPRDQPQVSGRGAKITSAAFNEAGDRTLYWELGAEMTGDKLTSYGGVLKITIRYEGHGPAPDAPMVMMRVSRQ